MSILIKASRLGTLVAFTTLSRSHGRSRRLYVPADALYRWLSDSVPCDFSVCGSADCLRLLHGPNGVVHARFTAFLYACDPCDDGSFTGFHRYADLPRRFFTELFEKGEARCLAHDDAVNPKASNG